MADEVVADPDALHDHARTVRARLLAIDVSAYRAAMGRFAGADHNDVGNGDMRDLAAAITHLLEEVERGTWAAELFAQEVTALDRARASGRTTGRVVPPTTLATVRRRIRALPAASLLDGAHARVRVLVDHLRDDLAAAADPAASRSGRTAAERRLALHLAGLLDVGIEGDPDLQLTVVTLLGPAWLADFAAMAARRDLDAAGTVPWTRAALAVLAGWTATWARRQSPGDLDAFVTALPPALVPVLATLADWGPDAGAAAAMHAWDAAPTAPLDPVAPSTWWRSPGTGTVRAPMAWPPTGTTREAVAVMLATHPATALRVLTERDDVLAALVTSVSHPAAAEAVAGGLVRQPARRLATTADVDGLRASAAAVARLVASAAGPGARRLSPAGRAVVATAVRFHVRMAVAGWRESLPPFLHDGTGTHAWLADAVLGDRVAATPNAVRGIVAGLAGSELGMLVSTLARTEDAGAALVVVGHEFAAMLARAGDAGDGVADARDLLQQAGPQAVAVLTAAAVDAGDTRLLAGLGRGFAAALAEMPRPHQRDWLEMLAAADDRAGWASVLLASSDGLPSAMLPVMLGMERPGTMLPRSRAVRQVLDDVTGDWTAWSAQLYGRMFADLGAPLAVVLGMARGDVPTAIAARNAEGHDPRRQEVGSVAGRLASGAVSSGLARALGALVVARPHELVELLDRVDRGDGVAFAEIAALVELTQPDGGPGLLVEAVGGHLLADAFTSSASPLARGTADGHDLDRVQARFHRAGELIGQLEAFARPRGTTADVAVVLRVVVVRLAAEVPVVGTIAGAVDDVITLAGAVDGPARDLAAVARVERASIMAAMDVLASATTTRRQVLEDFGFVLDDDGDVVALPAAEAADPTAVLAAHPEYLPFFTAAEALADGLEAGRALLDQPAID